MTNKHANSFTAPGAHQARPTVSVVGARGYSGQELVRLLRRHPGIQLSHCYGTSEFALSETLLHDSSLAAGANSGRQPLQVFNPAQLLETLTDLVFLATPAEVSLQLAPQIVAAGKTVIDLSGAFRLPPAALQKWYGLQASAESAELQKASDYGLVPFCGPLAPETRLIANPGCYATAISMALIPLLKHDLIEPGSVSIDAKSGTTGAGRKPTENLLFSEVSEDCVPYKVGEHQHLPEIQQSVQRYAGVAIDPHMVTHLLPVRRGISAAIFARSKGAAVRSEQVQAAFEAEYANYPLALMRAGVGPHTRLQSVVYTPFVHFGFSLTGNKLYLISLLDNLQKGAASQALENLNRWLDLPTYFSLLGGE